ncbi:MAG: alkane 1-monooxygenase [Pseudomonadota bacterium]
MFLKALPFFVSYITVPLILAAAWFGGWFIALPFAWGWIGVTVLDRVMGLNTENMDTATKDDVLWWYNMVTWSWVPLQTILFIAVMWLMIEGGHLSAWEQVGVALGLGVATGGVGITFAHELVHQRNRWERWAGEYLLTMVSYGHFATEHVHGHHITVGTPEDPVTARKGENFFAFFVRAVFGTITHAWKIDASRLTRRGKPVWHKTNPWWRYMAGLAVFAGFCFWLGGAWGLVLFSLQAFMAIYQLEAVNYVEHYGLTRRYLGRGKFERVQPHHSWNASHTVSNWFLINLQRHSDHHYRPDRRFPLLQHFSWDEAPQLPCGYALMIFFAVNPPIWFRVMDKRVDRWREKFYPDITDWTAYDNGTIGTDPVPQGAPAAA